EIVNFSPAPQTVHVTVTRGDASVVDRRVAMGAGEALRQVLPLAWGADPSLHAHLEAPDNALAVDDDAFAWIDRARVVSVAVIGSQTNWLRPFLASDPGLKPAFFDPSKYE